MSKNNGNLTEQSSPSSNTAILMIDMISDFEFEDGQELFKHSLPLAEHVAKFKQKCKEAGIPFIYVNDNHGRWHEDFEESVEELINSGKRGSKIAKILKPEKDDYHIIKPQRSAFYATPLGALLISLNVSNLILTGVTTDICVLISALDAQMRGYRVYIPSDCTAAVKPEYHDNALVLLERIADADIRNSCELDLDKFVRPPRPDPVKEKKLPENIEFSDVDMQQEKLFNSNTDNFLQTSAISASSYLQM